MFLTKELLLSIIKELGYLPSKTNTKITLDLVVEAIVKEVSITNYIQNAAGCSKQSITNFLKNTFPDRDPKKDKHLLGFILRKTQYKYCPSCKKILIRNEDFNKNASERDGLGTNCRECACEYRRDSYAKNPYKEQEANKNRKSLTETRTPPWANIEKIKEIYRNCPEGCHIDHVIPLRGELVSGLHIETNLKPLTEKANLAKSNSFDIEKFNNNESWYDDFIPEDILLRKYDGRAYRIQLCPQCNQEFEVLNSIHQECCSRTCSNLYKTNNQYTKEFIEQLIWSKPLSIGCKEVGMSDNGLKKMGIRLGCKMPPPYYHSKSLSDKERIYKEAHLATAEASC